MRLEADIATRVVCDARLQGRPDIRPGDSTTANTPYKGPIYSVVRRSMVVVSRMIKDSERRRLLRPLTRPPKTRSWPPQSLSNTSGATTYGFRTGMSVTLVKKSSTVVWFTHTGDGRVSSAA
ncbi:hypothetical protein MRX96_044763 [Rhipicephalus microplus]